MDGTATSIEQHTDHIFLTVADLEPVVITGSLAEVARAEIAVGDRVKLRLLPGHEALRVADQLQTFGPVDDNGGRRWQTFNATAVERESLRSEVVA